MSIDFNTLVSKPQSSVINAQSVNLSAESAKNAAVSNAALQKDEFVPEKPKDSKDKSQLKKVLKKAAKYSGVAALILTPAALVVNQKMNAKAMNSLKNELTQSFTSALADAGKKTAEAASEIGSKTIQEQINKLSAKTDAIHSTVKNLALLLGGIGGIQIIGGKLNGNEAGATRKVNLKDSTVELLNTEATKRIDGTYNWPKIDKINAWMVTAETQTFLKVGGLAEVGVQLPDVFNKKHSSDGENMTIVTPLYLGKGSKTAALEKVDDNHFVYNGSEKKNIKLEKTDSFNMKVYDDKNKKFKNEKVDVLTGENNGTKYIFLKNDKYFGITPSEKNNKLCQGAYVLNDNNIGEVERMAFFSKASYELMLRAKQGKNKSVTAPNMIIANDWHASPLSSLMRYDAPVRQEKGSISKEDLDYINTTPIIHITHNAQYQGSDNENADRIFRTLFEENTDDINASVKGYEEKGFPLSRGMGNYNSALADLYLADRTVAVSSNYAQELCKAKDLGCGLEDINKIRNEKGTMTGIVNGYTKTISEPNQKLIDSINSKLSPAKPFVAFDNKYNEEGYALKMQNKESMINLLNDLAKQADEGKELPGFKLYKPENCKIPENADISKIPLMVNVGRFVEQKGYDYLVESLNKVLKNLKPGDERPIVAVLGSGDPLVSKQLNKLKDDVAKVDPIAAERIFMFEGFSAALRDALGVSSDFFLIPSKWEPCGLTQMESMPKGSLPIATATGGLVDTIEDEKDGFVTDVFYGYQSNEKIYDNGNSGLITPSNNSDAFAVTLNRALQTYYKSPDKIKQMAINAMEKDFSWDVPGGSLDKYEELMRTGKIN